MSVFLHPQYKLRWFKKHWTKDKYRKALAYIDKQYNITKSRHGVAIAPTDLTPIQKELTDYDAFNRLLSPSDDDDDDLHRYKSARIVAFGTDPLQ
jgi:hypothetical protein